MASILKVITKCLQIWMTYICYVMRYTSIEERYELLIESMLNTEHIKLAISREQILHSHMIESFLSASRISSF